MPCGGIEPILFAFGKEFRVEDSLSSTCFICHKPCDKFDLYCHEWDCYLHYKCFTTFLLFDEGMVVIKHKHEIQAICREVLMEEFKETEQ